LLRPFKGGGNLGLDLLTLAQKLFASRAGFQLGTNGLFQWLVKLDEFLQGGGP
jgi:hypothetical protein